MVTDLISFKYTCENNDFQALMSNVGNKRMEIKEKPPELAFHLLTLGNYLLNRIINKH